jgi:hypothetical protein
LPPILPRQAKKFGVRPFCFEGSLHDDRAKLIDELKAGYLPLHDTASTFGEKCLIARRSGQRFKIERGEVKRGIE